MERAAAIRKLTKILGKSLCWRIDDKAPTTEEREKAIQQLPSLAAARNQVEKAMNDRRQAVLAADQQYQELAVAYKDAKKRVAETASIARQFKITVGVSNRLFFHVKAEGDSWEEVIAKLPK